MVVGAWLRRRSVDFRPFLLYAGLLFAFSGLVSAVHVPTGRSSTRASRSRPQAYLLALEGVVAVGRLDRPPAAGWNAESAGRVFVGGIVGISLARRGLLHRHVHETWGHERDLDQAVGAALGAPARRPTTS